MCVEETWEFAVVINISQHPQLPLTPLKNGGQSDLMQSLTQGPDFRRDERGGLGNENVSSGIMGHSSHISAHPVVGRGPSPKPLHTLKQQEMDPDLRRDEWGRKLLNFMFVGIAMMLVACGEPALSAKSDKAFHVSKNKVRQSLAYDKKAQFDEALTKLILSHKENDAYVAISLPKEVYEYPELEIMPYFTDVVEGMTGEQIIVAHDNLRLNSGYDLEKTLKRYHETKLNERSELNLQTTDAKEVSKAVALDKDILCIGKLVWRLKTVKAEIEETEYVTDFNYFTYLANRSEDTC